MTQDLTVQNKRPSAIPYVVGGTAAGALAGWGASKLDFTKAAKYSSWDDVLRESKDLFEAAKKDGASDAVKETATSVKENLRNYYKGIKSTVDAAKSSMTAENTALKEAKTKFKDLWTKNVDDVVSKIKSGELKIKDFNVTNTTADDEILKKARTYVRENMSKELKEAKTALNEAAGKLKSLKFTEEQKKVIAEKAKTAWEAVKDKVKDIKEPRTKAMLIGGAAVGLLLAFLLRPKAKKEQV